MGECSINSILSGILFGNEYRMKLPKIEYEIIAMNDTKQFLIGIFERLLNFGNKLFFWEYRNADNANTTSPITGKDQKK